MLRERFDAATLCEPGKFSPHPTSGDRAFWDGLPPRLRSLVAERAEEARTAAWPTFPASLALVFLRTGSREAEGPMMYRRLYLSQLALGRVVLAEDALVDPLIDAIWSTCEESSWAYPAHLHEQGAGSGLPDVEDPLLDLGVGDTGALLAWTSYLLADDLDAVSPLVRPRIALECRRRATDVLLHRRPHHWQTAVNNWNPWIVSNVLAMALFTDTDRDHRDAVVTKAVETLDHFIDHYPADGGCDEGPTYWTRAGGQLIGCLELLDAATGGALDVFAEPLIGEIGRYIHRAHIGDDWFVNFADGGARFLLPSCGWRYGRAIGDPGLTALGWEHLRRAWQGELRYLDWFPNLLPVLPHLDELLTADPIAIPLARDVELPDIQVLVARDEADSAAGWFLASKGGHNDEVHNHNDIGSCVVFLDGEPVLVDAGVGPYSRATFSHERYTIWTMQSGWHSVPVINGAEQRNGRAFAASDWTVGVGDDTTVSCDLAGAYPPEAGVASWVRTSTLVRGEGIDLTDAWKFGADGGRAELRFLTCHEPKIEGRSAILGPAILSVDDDAFELRVTSRDLAEVNIAATWGDRLHRIDVVGTRLPTTGSATVSLRRA